MSWANFVGLSDCGPSDSASSGRGCTSMISPSAPHATAALAMGATRSQWPVPCDGSTTTGRCESFFSTGTALRSSVKRVVGLEGADAALAQDHVRVARGQDVLGGEQELLDGRGHAALEQHGLAHLAHAPEQREVLDVARADLEHVGVLGDELDALRLEHLGDHGQPGALARLGEVLRPCSLSPWNA